ncbi:hypothetical protein EV702DRAFT_625948 [Suillus placidus]|uniref:Uncharacterized protein n=1 Tax=Suillus placidus TaxID=48579 RepID=A0A9P7CY84_9AGAM|nr:hypothetical protein EV702DRAFT_625948 [Suillus placidus]
MPTSSTADRLLDPSSSSNDSQWCALPENPFCRVFFKALCMIAISKSSVTHWEELRQNPEQPKWDKQKKMVINRFENMNIVAGLVLTSSAVFISTSPPTQSFIPYGNQGSYILEVMSFVAALISLMTGTSVLIIYDTCYAHKDVLESFKESRLRLVCCLILMAFPSLALVVSTLALMTAVFTTGFISDKLVVKVLTAGICTIFVALAGLAIYVFKAPIKKAVDGNGKVTESRSREMPTIASDAYSMTEYQGSLRQRGQV